MHRFASMRAHVVSAVEALQARGALPEALVLDAITVDLPREAAHGDMATNAAMVLAKPAGKSPKDIAALLAVELAALPEVAKAEPAGPGFLNLTMHPAYWQRLVGEVLAAGTAYGASTQGNDIKVNVEYVSANPTGPMHVGHSRGAVFGDALARLLIKAGYAVTKEYYINDAGSQIDTLSESVFLRYREACGETIEIPQGLYPGDYLIPVGQALFAEQGKVLLDQPRESWMPIVKKMALERMMLMIREDLALLGIHHDRFVSEQEVRDTGKVEEAIQELQNKGLLYEGVLEPPKGKPVPEDWEPRPQLLFKSTQFGDDLDRALKKSDGSWTYVTPDIAYHWDKIRRGYTRIVDVFGADHTGYVKRLTAAVTALSGGSATLEVKLCQLVKFLRGGEPAKMSKRAGTFVTVRDVVEEVGPDVLRFIMLTRKNDQALDFDFDKVMEQSKDNPVFYVQYAHARCHSVLRHAEASYPALLAQSQAPDMLLLSQLNDGAELTLIKRMAFWPRLVESAANAYEPHRVAFYLQELAAEFHALWNAGQDNAELRFLLPAQPERTAARLALVSACATVIAAGLEVLGVTPLKELRA